MIKSQFLLLLEERYSKIAGDKWPEIFEFFLNEMIQGLCNKKRIEIRGFGAFSLRKRESRVARNPGNNNLIEIGEKYAVYFRPGKDLKNIKS